MIYGDLITITMSISETKLNENQIYTVASTKPA
jgi:hypothetical protein